jgi:hypothetical protein
MKIYITSSHDFIYVTQNHQANQIQDRCQIVYKHENSYWPFDGDLA